MSDIARTKAEEVYSTLCGLFDNKGWRYEKEEDDLLVKCTFLGEDLPMDFFMRVYPDQATVALFSPLHFSVPEDKRLTMAAAVCAVNDSILDGSFDFDIRDGQLLFRMNNSYLDCDPSMEVFDYMLGMANAVVDAYNDRFLMLAKGDISIDQFLAKVYRLEGN